MHATIWKRCLSTYHRRMALTLVRILYERYAGGESKIRIIVILIV